MATEREKLGRSIAAAQRGLARDPDHEYAPDLAILLAAAVKHFATLPEPLDHIIIGRHRPDASGVFTKPDARGTFLYQADDCLCTAQEARNRVARLNTTWPHVAYTAVKVPA